MHVKYTYYLYSCFLSHRDVFFGAFLAPILAVMVFNIFIFVWVIVVVIRHSRNTAALQKKDISLKSILRKIVSISGIMSLFGLTWIFAVFTFLPINEPKTVFDSFFVIFNSFQGLFIFFFYIVLNKEIRESWKELLSCGKYQSKHLPHFQPKTAPKVCNSGKNNLTIPTGAKGTTEPSNETAKLESDDTKTAPQLESSLNPDREMIELDKLSIKTAISIKATVIMKVINETKEPREEIAVGGESKAEDKDMVSMMRIKRYSTLKEFKHHVEQVEVDFYDDDSDKEESTK